MANDAWLDIWFDTPALNQGKPARRSIKTVLDNATEREIKTRARKEQRILIKTPHQYVLYPDGAFVVLVA